MPRLRTSLQVRFFKPNFLLALPLLAASTAQATPANKKALTNYFETFIAPKLDACTTCHLPSNNHDPQSLDEFPHNAFGDRLRKLGVELKNRKTIASIQTRIQALADEDTDKDGTPNLAELLLGSAPGDAKDKPDATALSRLAERRQAFDRFLHRYAWEPFEPVNRPAVPAVGSRAAGSLRIHKPIDAFIAEQHDARRLHSNAEAPPEALIRRLYLDLVGLVPSPAEVDEFVRQTKDSKTKDQRPDVAAVSALVSSAYDALVNKLLASPQYGERWGRHWMDIWRYSDWDGYKEMVRLSQPHIWRWRDWIVESLNENKPFDQMVREMLAADEIAPEDNDMLRATGFLVRNYQADRLQWMDNVVEHTSKAFLGLTMNCVKCHDHKYDPIPQIDYYRIRAVFEPYNVRTDPLPGEIDPAKDGLARAYDQSLQPVTYVFQRGDERFPIKDRPVAPGVPEIFSGSLEVRPVPLPLTAKQPEKRDYVRAALLDEARKTVAAARSECGGTTMTARNQGDGAASQRLALLAAAKLAAAEARLAMLTCLLPLETAEDRGISRKSGEWQSMATRTHAAQLEADYLAARYAKLAADQAAVEAAGKNSKAADAAKKKAADADKKFAAAEKMRAAGPKAEYKPRAVKTFPDSSTGRRLAFANWLTGRDNTLFARVAVNHIWLRHFGTGIVTTPEDFGANGRKPTHPSLLDWLAAEFIDSGYDMKHMHRLIVNSAAYRMASTHDDSNAKIDPDNVWLWRAPTRRMEGEVVRDNLLHIAGLLDATPGGPDIDNAAAETSRRRSLYLRHAQEKLVEFVQIFDGPRPTECYQREKSIKPHQALALINSRLTLEAACALEKNITAATGGDADSFIKEAFRRILGRSPNPDESELCQRFASQPGRDQTRARQQLLAVLFNHNDFVAIR